METNRKSKFCEMFQHFVDENDKLFVDFQQANNESISQHQENVNVLIQQLKQSNQKMVGKLLMDFKNEIASISNGNNSLSLNDGEREHTSIPISMKNAAIFLSDNQYRIVIGRNKLFRYLRILKYLDKDNIPYQKYLNDKLFKVVHSRSGSFINIKVFFTQKGYLKLRNELLQCASDDMGLGIEIVEGK